MTVAEYIAELKKMPQDLEMWFHSDEHECFFKLGRGPRDVFHLQLQGGDWVLDPHPENGKGQKKKVCHI
jgi:hypothetical protein